MKKLIELGISPAPWGCVTRDGMNAYVVGNAHLPHGDSRRVFVAADVIENNARLIAAAPKLYEALREVQEQMCGHCDLRDICRNETEDGIWSPCNMMHHINDALGEVGGEEAKHEEVE